MRGGGEHGSMVRSARQTWSHCRGTPRGGSGGGISLSAPSGRGAKTRVTAGGRVSHDSSERRSLSHCGRHTYLEFLAGLMGGHPYLASVVAEMVECLLVEKKRTYIRDCSVVLTQAVRS